MLKEEEEARRGGPAMHDRRDRRVLEDVMLLKR